MSFDLTKHKKTVLIVISVIIATSICVYSIGSAFKDKSSRQVPIIMYHSIIKDESEWNDLVLSPVELEKDFIWLKEKGYQPVFVDDLIKYVNAKVDLPEKPVVITFDNGYYNNLTYVLPLLEKYDFRATFSIVGSYSEYACEEAEPSPSHSYLDWNDMIQMQKSCRCEFSNQSYALHSLGERRGCLMKDGETYEEFRHVFLSDIFKTQHLLEDNCNISPKVFSYPYGLICDASERLVKNSGFSASLSSEEKSNTITIGDKDCLFNLGRINRPAFIDTKSFMKKHDID